MALPVSKDGGGVDSAAIDTSDELSGYVIVGDVGEGGIGERPVPKRAAGIETGPGLNADGVAAGDSMSLLEEGEEDGVSPSGVSAINRAASEAEATVDELL
jgi:hypothetical protein